eukprot:scaffold2857_cov121-Isochrysis_galbana.AAC.5
MRARPARGPNRGAGCGSSAGRAAGPAARTARAPRAPIPRGWMQTSGHMRPLLRWRGRGQADGRAGRADRRGGAAAPPPRPDTGTAPSGNRLPPGALRPEGCPRSRRLRQPCTGRAPPPGPGIPRRSPSPTCRRAPSRWREEAAPPAGWEAPRRRCPPTAAARHRHRRNRPCCCCARWRAPPGARTTRRAPSARRRSSGPPRLHPVSAAISAAALRAPIAPARRAENRAPAAAWASLAATTTAPGRPRTRTGSRRKTACTTTSGAWRPRARRP